MYPDTSPTTPVEVDHGNTLPLVDQAAARPCPCSAPAAGTPAKTVGYSRCSSAPDDVRAAVVELNRLGVASEHIYLDQPGERPQDGLQLALQALNPGDTFAVANLARLARSLARSAQLAEQVDTLGAHLEVAGERLAGLPPAKLLQLAAAAQVILVDQALSEVAWTHRLRRHDQRHSFHHVDAVQRVWLQQLYDAGRPRLQLGQDFGVSRATVYRFVTDPADETN